MSHIKCECCKYVRPDKLASSRGWTAYECGNEDSEYYGALLNITHNGDKLNSVTWVGCACGKRDNASALRFGRLKPIAVYTRASS